MRMPQVKLRKVTISFDDFGQMVDQKVNNWSKVNLCKNDAFQWIIKWNAMGEWIKMTNKTCNISLRFE